MDHKSTYQRLSERYSSGEVPWDDELPPPEIIDSVAALKPGKAIDLGCGYGRTAIYLARLGWDVDAIDFIPYAIEEAQRRAENAGVKIQFHLANVLDLNFLTTTYDFGVDVGCCHNMNESELMKYEEQLARLLRSGALFLLFARIKGSEERNDESGPSGLAEKTILATFADSFKLIWIKRGETEIPDSPIWPSAWFKFERR